MDPEACMTIESSDAVVKQQLELLYQQRVERLKNLKLRDLLKHNSHLHDLIWSTDIVEILSGLIDGYLESHENWWQNLTTDLNFCIAVIRLNSLYPQIRYLYESTRAAVRARFITQMIDEFCRVDYSLDWEKLLLVNHVG